MLKNFFISMLGAIAGFWISIMLFFVVMFATMIGSAASAFVNSSNAKAVSVSDNSVLLITLDTSIEEVQTPGTFESVINNTPASQTLRNLIRAIRAAKDDKKIEGIYIYCGGSSAGIATREALREALLDFKESGKWIMTYADSYTQGDYYLASCADYLYLNPSGTVDIKGLGTGIPFFKGLLDKIGVKMEVYKVGTFKSAVEPYILENMSEANREMTSFFLNNIWTGMAKSIAESRNVKLETVNMWADSMITCSSAETLVDLKIVDSLKYIDEVEKELRGLTGVTDDDKSPSLIEYSAYLANAELPEDKKNDNKIAIYYAVGDIVDSGDGGIIGEKVVPEILELAKDDDIKALVLRVNSGGGSAYASEQIWHALEVFKSKGKKLYVSMGDYAASGGYYISCGADKIYAEPYTLTGSIGIFGMIPCAKELLNDKLGVNIDYVTTNANGAFPSITEPATPFQREKMQGMINRGYELFTGRCAEGRHMPIDSIKAIAEGRVWDGATAKRLGLVDELGGLNLAIEDLAREMKYKKYQVVTYPAEEPSIWDIFSEMSAVTKARTLREELGSYYPIYMELKRLENLDPIQARMLPVTVE